MMELSEVAVVQEPQWRFLITRQLHSIPPPPPSVSLLINLTHGTIIKNEV